MTAAVHVESDPENADMLCGAHGFNLNPVALLAWLAEPERVQAATCEQCLLRLFMLGDSARIALERMGRRVEVHDVPSEMS